MYICPKCGAEEGAKKFVGPFCIDCVQFSIKVPSGLEMQKCKRCNKVLMRGKWALVTENRIEKYIEGKFRGEFDKAEFILAENRAKFQIERDGQKLEVWKDVDFKFLTSICPECNKMAGGYFEAIIQLRGKPERIVKYNKLFQKELADAGTFISKILEDKHGMDIYVGSTRAVLSVIKEMGLTYKISSSLAGQKQGKRLYRTSFAIRL